MARQITALDTLDGPVRIAKPQATRQVHVFRARQSFIEETQRRVVLGTHQAIDNAPRLVCAHDHFQSCGFEYRTGGINGGLMCLRLAHQLHQVGRRIVAVAVTCEADHIGTLFPGALAAMHSETLDIELNDNGLYRVVRGMSAKLVKCTQINDDLTAPRRLLHKCLVRRKRAARSLFYD